jgi:hypothetical protein
MPLQHADLQPHELESQLLALRRHLQSRGSNYAQLVHPEQQVVLRSSGTLSENEQQQQQQQQQQPLTPQQQQQQQQPPLLTQEQQQEQTDLNILKQQQQQQPLPTDDRSVVVVASDACLRALPKPLTPLGLPLLLSLELPPSRDVLQRRLAAVFGGSRQRGRGRAILIDLVSAGETAAFRTRERASSAPVSQMPLHAPDVFVM